MIDWTYDDFAVDSVQKIVAEKYLPGIVIDGYDTNFSLGGLGLNAPSPNACMLECEVRGQYCSAWTYDPSLGTKNCYLKDPGCCGQSVNYQESATAISGYACDESFCDSCELICVLVVSPNNRPIEDLSATVSIFKKNLIQCSIDYLIVL